MSERAMFKIAGAVIQTVAYGLCLWWLGWRTALVIVLALWGYRFQCDGQKP